MNKINTCTRTFPVKVKALRQVVLMMAMLAIEITVILSLVDVPSIQYGNTHIANTSIRIKNMNCFMLRPQYN